MTMPRAQTHPQMIPSTPEHDQHEYQQHNRNRYKTVNRSRSSSSPPSSNHSSSSFKMVMSSAVLLMLFMIVIVSLSIWNTIRIDQALLSVTTTITSSAAIPPSDGGFVGSNGNNNNNNNLIMSPTAATVSATTTVVQRQTMTTSTPVGSSPASTTTQQQGRLGMGLSAAAKAVGFSSGDATTTTEGGKPWYQLTIGIVTNASTEQRFKSLRRLVESILSADYSLLQQQNPVPQIRLHISMDTATSAEVMSYMSDLEWPYGPKTIHKRVASAGLVAAVAETWYPSDPHREVGLILEDDIEVSPLYFEWVHNALMAAPPSGGDDRMAGISLYTPRRVEISKQGKYRFDSSKLMEHITAKRDGGSGNSGGGDPTTPYLHQLPCSWGALYYPQHWKVFVDYMSGRLELEASDEEKIPPVNVPNSHTPGWKTSWKKFFIELMYVKGWYMLYPSYPNQLSFSTNHLEVGEHITHNDTDHLAEDYTVPLMQPTDLQYLKQVANREDPLHVPPVETLPVLSWTNVPYADTAYLDALKVASLPEDIQAVVPATSSRRYDYSYWSKEEAGVVTLPIDRVGNEPIKELEKAFPRIGRPKSCTEFHPSVNNLLSNARTEEDGLDRGVTILIATYDRLDVLKMQIEYYTQSPVVKSIMITWHNHNRTPPPPMKVNGVFVDFLPQKVDSLNSRFHPVIKVTTDAVIIMDDDMKVHLEDIALLYEVWKSNKDNIVGFYPRRMVKNDEKYSWDGPDRFDEPYTMMLTKVMMLHKRFLYEYSCGDKSVMTDIWNKVDEEMNCEDLAMNFVVSHMTYKPAPLFVDSLHFVGDFGDSKYTSRDGVHGAIHQRNEETKKKDHRVTRASCWKKFKSALGMIPNGLPKQRYKILAYLDPNTDSSSSNRVVMLERARMGDSPNTPNVLDFTATCGYDDKNGTLIGSTDAWHHVVRPNVRTPPATNKLSGPDMACNFHHTPSSLPALSFAWIDTGAQK